MPAPTKEQLALQMCKVSKGYIGVSRVNNVYQVSRFLAVFDLPFEENGEFVSFCAAGVSFAAMHAECDLRGYPYTADNAIEIFKTQKGLVHKDLFLPDPRCHIIRDDAIAHKTWVPGKPAMFEPQQGFLVMYNWSGGYDPEHVEIVDNAGDAHMNTIGFNTSDHDNKNGGAVAARIRNYDNVVGWVQTY